MCSGIGEVPRACGIAVILSGIEVILAVIWYRGYILYCACSGVYRRGKYQVVLDDVCFPSPQVLHTCTQP